MADILMAEARVREIDGRIVYVQPEGTPHVPGHRYFSEQFDRGNTFCPCCTVPVVYRSASPSVMGSTFRGRQAHFALKPGGKHDEGCDILSRPAYERHLIPDRTKGYRIHINTREYSETFNDAAGVYGKGPNGRIQITNPDIRDRERIVIKGADGLINFFKNADPARVADSKIIFRNRAIGMEDFFIRRSLDGKNVSRFTRLLERLEKMPDGEETLCAMVVPVKRGTTLGPQRRTVKGEMVKIPSRQTADMPESIVPEIYARNRSTTHILWGFEQPGDYLVMGVPRLRTNDGDVRRFHHISLTLDDPKGFARIDLKEILKNNSEAQARRARKQDAGTHPAP